MLQAHEQLNSAFRGLADARIGAIADAVPAGLTEDQKRAFRYATEAGGKLRTITGVPGAGKPRLINAVADAHRAEGYTVRAVSVANSAVEVLRTGRTCPRDRSPPGCGGGCKIASGWGHATSTRPRPWAPLGRAIC